ncbi:MAG: hypothetical protein LQ351_003114 [Letrouitia transgressa]|nr:MAG: hypothetical protein LQ351_003114 [Letrouitia transgressa]
MPYNTRRKSLSLPSLGIQLPNASRAHRPSVSRPSGASEAQQQPPVKKVKRSHISEEPSPISSSRPRSSTTASLNKSVSFAERPKGSGRNAYEHTPPPSPGSENDTKIDIEEINDDIVTGVIEQLEKTGNRPHLIKELAMVLSTTNDAVLSSANPAALLSSRLAAYIRRDCWTAQSPCPLGKELIPVHPRKVFYFLTTTVRQEIPVDSTDIITSPLINSFGSGGKGGKRIISPSLSNASIDGDAEGLEQRKRDALSPSPEVDLSIPELDAVTQTEDEFHTPPTPGSLSARSSLTRDGSAGSTSDDLSLAHNHRAQSPPLEGDEKEFTQTASSMRMRGMSFDEHNIRQTTEIENTVADTVGEMQIDESEEERASRNQEDGATLFGGHHTPETGLGIMSSPMVKPTQTQATGGKTIKEETMNNLMADSGSTLEDQDLGLGWEMQEPESIQLEELDDLFGGY